MKANQKFLAQDDEGVSPVIAVILMVAITVVLAATVYVWVSGFGSQSSQPAKSLSLTSSSGLSAANKTYTVASATSGMKWSDVTLTIDGVSQTMNNTADSTCAVAPNGPAQWYACTGGARVTSSSSVISAGDQIRVEATSGQTLRLLDSQANSVMLTLTIG